jgi:acyl-CoA thioesterase-1
MDKKICLFGDSIGKGVFYDAEKRKYAFLTRPFAALLGERLGIQVDNRSRFGCTITKGASMVEAHKDDLKDYDYIALMFGGNDCNFDWDKVEEAPEAEHECTTPLSVFTDTYKKLIEFITQNGGKPAILSMIPVDFKKYFDWIVKSHDSMSILRFLRVKERIERWNEMYNLALWGLSRDTGTPILDIRSPFLASPELPDFYCEDGIHINAAGHKLLCDQLFNLLRAKPYAHTLFA